MMVEAGIFEVEVQRTVALDTQQEVELVEGVAVDLVEGGVM